MALVLRLATGLYKRIQGLIGAPPMTNALLLETGDYLLLEDDCLLLLE